MNKDDYQMLLMLKNYFKDNCSNLVFSNEMCLDGDIRLKMYYVNVDNITEKNNYKKVFQEYLTLYINSYERLRYYELDLPSASKILSKYSEDTWKGNSLLVNTNINSSGLFGELFNDFYINIVKDENILLTYSQKRGFYEKNVKGVDVVGCTLKDDKLLLIYSESKFVSDAITAKNNLVDDIKGKKEEKSHITKDYINKFTTFMLDKGHSLYSGSDETVKKIINIINELNKKCFNQIKPIDAFNDLDITIRFVFFAIYTDNYFTPVERRKYYEEIINTFNNQIIDVGLNKYEIEIVFIPITNKSADIKKEMILWD